MTLLASLSDLKSELGLTDDASDTALTAALSRASAVIETYCGRDFARAGDTFIVRVRDACRVLILPRVPIVSVASVEREGDPLSPTEWEIEDAEAGFLIRLDTSDRPTPWWGRGKWSVSYTGGPETVPPDVERCCLDLAVAAWRARGRDPMIRDMDVVDVESWSVFDPDKRQTVGGLPGDIADRLDRHRREVF